MKKRSFIRKQLLSAAFFAAIILNRGLTAEAAEPAAGMTQASGINNQIVCLDVELADCGEATTFGISLEYDTDALEFLTDQCSFTTNGTLQNFDLQKGVGLWASQDAKDINGNVCELVFRIRENAQAGVSNITADVVVKRDSETILNTVVQSNVTINCEHVWDEGSVEKEATETTEGLLVYNCTKCSATKTQVIAATGGNGGSNSGQNTNQKPNQNPNQNSGNGSNSGTVTGSYSYNSIKNMTENNEEKQTSAYLAQKRQQQIESQLGAEQRRQLYDETAKLIEEASGYTVEVNELVDGTLSLEVADNSTTKYEQDAENGEEHLHELEGVTDNGNINPSDDSNGQSISDGVRKPYMFVVIMLMIVVIFGVFIGKSAHFGQKKGKK